MEKEETPYIFLPLATREDAACVPRNPTEFGYYLRENEIKKREKQEK